MCCVVCTPLCGCTLFYFFVEIRGNDRGTSVDFRGCCHGLPWKSAGFHGKGHGSWRFHGQCHGCGHGTCRGFVRGKLRGTNHDNPWKSAAIATAISADVKPQQCPRPSAAIRGHCHGNPFPRQSSDTRQLPRKSEAIATAISADVKPQQFPLPSAAILRCTAIATEVHGNCHSNFHNIPRPSAAIELRR